MWGIWGVVLGTNNMMIFSSSDYPQTSVLESRVDLPSTNYIYHTALHPSVSQSLGPILLPFLSPSLLGM
jgi:hypothetical protein